MRASDTEKALADTIRSLFQDQKYDKARVLLDGALRATNHRRFRRLEARFELFEGNEDKAAEILKAILPHIWHPGSWELAISGAGACRARELAVQKILFFPIRKCASTSVLNALKLVDNQGLRGEDVHEEDHTMAPCRIDDLTRTYKDYFCFSLVRDPIERLLSFFYGNIVARDQLANHHGGVSEFYGLPTKPDLPFFLQNLARYRQVFITARNHTEPVVSYLGADPSLFSWIGGLKDLPGLMEKLEARSGRKLPVLSHMGSPEKPVGLPDLPEDVSNLYIADYRHYSPYF